MFQMNDVRDAKNDGNANLFTELTRLFSNITSADTDHINGFLHVYKYNNVNESKLFITRQLSQFNEVNES